ncbi:MAG: AbrB/MazE/SpoVT family DNA-binding domain-containing protein [Haloarculaceae archaeon]
MTDDDGLAWPPMFKGMQEASEQAIEQQQQMMRQLFGAGASGMDMNQLGAMSQMAAFKTRVQSGGRISIPDAEREALDIEEGDIVQAVVLPVKRNRE